MNHKWFEVIDTYRAKWEECVGPDMCDASSSIILQRAAAKIDRVLSGDTILVSEIGVRDNWQFQFDKPTQSDSLIGGLGFSPMECGESSGLGAKLAVPDCLASLWYVRVLHA